MNARSGSVGRRAFVVGVLISLVILAIVLHDLDWAASWSTLRRTRLEWVVLACVAISASVFVRCWRWRVVSGLGDVTVATFWRATVLGYVGSAIYPARFGDVVRVLALQRNSGKSAGLVLGGAVADRLWDMLIFGAIGTVVILITGQIASVGRSVVAVLLGTIGIAGAVRLLATHHERVMAILERLARRLPERLGNRLSMWTNEALRFFATTQGWRATMFVLVLSSLAALVDYVGIYLCLVSIDLPLPFLASILTGVLISLAGLLPAAPGYLGIYQIGAVLGLGYFGVGKADAVAASIVIHAATLVVILVLGLWCVVRYGRQTFNAAW